MRTLTTAISMSKYVLARLEAGKARRDSPNLLADLVRVTA
jgi:hypothetical protein